MRKFRKFIILSFGVLLFLALLVPVRGSADNSKHTFYVALNGSDSNSGTLEQPWATLNHAAEVLKAGETVYVRGGKYLTTQQIRPKNSGTEKAWIVYSGFPGEQVIIDAQEVRVGPPAGEPPYPQDQGAFQVEGVSYIRIQSLKVMNSHNAGFTVRDSHHIELYKNTTENTFSSGIAIWDTNHDGQDCHHHKVIENTIINANTHDMIVPGYPLEQEAPHEALSVGGAYYFEISSNRVYNSDKEGIDVKETSKHGSVHHNYVHHLGRQGLYVDSWFGILEDIEIYENIVHDCEGAGIALSTENGQLVNDVKIYHNLIYNNLGTGIFFSKWGGDGARKNIKIYNNLIAHNGYGEPNPGETYYWITGGLYLFSTNLENIGIFNNEITDNRGFQIGYSEQYLSIAPNINSVLQAKNIKIECNFITDNNNVKYPIYVGWPPNDYANVYAIEENNCGSLILRGDL